MARPSLPSPRASRRPLRPTRRRRRRALLPAAAAGLALLLAGCADRPDSLAPVVSVTSPKSGSVRTAGALEVSGFAMDDEGIEAIRVTIGGTVSDLLASEVYADQRGMGLVRFKYSVPAERLHEGELTTRIEAVDANGRVGALDFPLSIDATPPTLDLEVVPLSDGRLRVRGTARDNTRVASVRVAGTPLQFIPAAEYAFNIDVTVGEETDVVVADAAGNTTRRPLR